ncbi:MAG TPA: DUF4383 domain-containing protein [Candidatus Thermoplasmatota archaeon]|nr:DUF4383 domain-containing protein [Candidatus Thermoplasmatota archaeon]
MADIVNRDYNRTSAARWYARIAGIVLLLVGIVGFFTRDPLGINFELTTLHNWIHILTGAVALYFGFARIPEVTVANFAKVFGAIYLVIGIIGFFVNDILNGALVLTTVDDWFHVILGVAGLATGFMTAPEADRSRLRRPTV